MKRVYVLSVTLALLVAAIVPVESFSPNQNQKYNVKQQRHQIETSSTANLRLQNTSSTNKITVVQPPAITRRHALQAFIVTALCAPIPAMAMVDLGAELTKAVTTSDLGLSVRTSVVRGAQVMDKLDGTWEKFSDTFGLGAERSKQPGRPKEKYIPPPAKLNIFIAREFIQAADFVFTELTGVSKSALQRKVADVMELVRPSFQRSSEVSLSGEMVSPEQFNFISYAHFRTYGDLLLEYKTDFKPFRKQFEQQLGQRMWTILLQQEVSTTPSTPTTPTTPFTLDETGLSKTEILTQRLAAMERVEQALVDNGFVAQVDQSSIPPDKLKDWEDNVADLTFTVALDLDATLGAQLLLEEQGYRLLPCFARYALLSILQINGQRVTMDPYYFDTNYNSDPSLFEVKEVLLNVVLESAV